VFLVTGASSGVGQALAQILYAHDAKVYIAARSTEKANKAIAEIKAQVPVSKGELIFLSLDLDDLASVKKTAENFLANETRLDVLWNNAGVMVPPQGSKTKQGYEKQLGTNCVAPFLFTKLLTPLLVNTAKSVAPGSVRVVWVSSSTVTKSPPGGIDFSNMDYSNDVGPWIKYGISKAGNYYHATQFAKLHKDDGIISVSLHPGNLKTDLQRNMSRWSMPIVNMLVYPAIYGAYTELFAGLSPDVTLEKSGAWLQPWGRFSPQRADLVKGSKSRAEGGTGIAEEFWGWSEEQIKEYI
jgi:NAD(P)-dependent dehydrogenase (short-subunit alcohol dehydrogenase family)